jgi:hypothetical protein
MSIDGYFWLAGALVVSLVMVFGGDYESSQARQPAEACPAAPFTDGCLIPPQHGLPAMLL